MQDTTFEGVRLRNLENVHPEIKQLMMLFYKEQEELAVEREDYLQAAHWRDAAFGKIESVSVTQLEDGTWVINSANFSL